MTMTLKQRYQQVIERFQQAMPVAETELHYGSPFQLLVAVILSAQCTDKRVNEVCRILFELRQTFCCVAYEFQESFTTMVLPMAVMEP